MGDSAQFDPLVAAEADLTLIKRVLAGDPRAFEPLVRQHERRVFRVTLAVLGNIEDAEEAMQDAFVKAFRHLGKFRGESRFTTWLTRIAVNSALQIRQSRKDSISLDESRPDSEQFVPQRYERWRADPEKLYGKQEMRRMVEAAIRSLEPIYREAFILRDVEGMSAEEAASALEITIPAMKSRLLRARLMVREALAPSLEQPYSLKQKIATAATGIRDAVTARLSRTVGR